MKWIVLGVLMMCGRAAWAAGCTVSALGINFGVYDVFSNQPDDITGSITVSCAASTSYSIAISSGRFMLSGQNKLFYNLFVDSTRTGIWGDGTGGTSVVSTTDSGRAFPVYGRIEPRQNVAVGDYTDLVTVTVTY